MTRSAKRRRGGLRHRSTSPIAWCDVAAERRVERFLAGFGMARGRRRELVIQSCVARAVARWREQPGSDLRRARAGAGRGRAQPLVHGRARAGADRRAPAAPGRARRVRDLRARRAAGRACSRPATVCRRRRCDALQQAGFAPIPAEVPGSMVAQPLELLVGEGAADPPAAAWRCAWRRLGGTPRGLLTSRSRHRRALMIDDEFGPRRRLILAVLVLGGTALGDPRAGQRAGGRRPVDPGTRHPAGVLR